MTAPRPSLEDLFGRPSAPNRPTAQRPALADIFRPEPEPLGFFEGLGAVARGTAAGVHQTLASTAEKLSRVPTLGRENVISRTFREAGEGGTALLKGQGAQAAREANAFGLAQGVSRTVSEIGKYFTPGLGVTGATALGAGEAFGSAPEESEAGLGAELARRGNLPRVASALETASQTAPGRALTSVALSAIPDVALAGVRKVRGAGPAREWSRPIEAPPVPERLALPAAPSAAPSATPITDPARLLADPTRSRSRAGLVATEALGAVAGAGVGGTTALATAPEDDPRPLTRAAIGAVVGAVAGATGGRVVARRQAGFRPTAPLAASDDPLLRRAGEGIAQGRRAMQQQPEVLRAAEKAYTAVVSETYPLLVAAEVGGGKAGREAMADAIARQQGAGQMAQQYLRDRLAPAIRDLSTDAMDRLSTLLVYQRDLDIRSKGGAAKTALSADELPAVVQRLQADPAVATAAQQVRDMAADLLKRRHDAGLLSDEAYQAIVASEDYYVPFLRELAEDGSARIPAARMGRGPTSGVRRMDRTVEALEQLADPLEVLTMAAQRTFRDVTRQRVQNVLFDLADAGAVPFVTPNLAAGATPTGGQIQALRHGQRVTYDVDDATLRQALAPATASTLPWYERLARGMKDVKTAGITLDPAFALKNVARDVAMSGVQRLDTRRAAQEGAVGAALGAVIGGSEGETVGQQFINGLVGAGIGSGVGLYARPLVQTLGAMKSIVQRDEVFQQFLRDGGSTEGFFVKTPEDGAAILRQLRQTGVDPKDIVRPRSWVDALRFIGSVGEQGTRLAAYQQALDAGLGTGRAVREAQDRTLRFANIGAGTKGLAALTPFWNAKVQGWDKLGRMLQDPKTYAMGAAAITAPSVALWHINKDNPEYWQRPAWEKNLFWLVPKDSGGFYRVPKPFEVGFLFASLPERMLDYAAQAGVDLPGVGPLDSAAPVVAEPGRVLARAAGDMAASTFEGTLPVPAALSLPLQLAQGRDWFRQRDIVSRPGVLPAQQVEPETSALARALAKAGVAPQKTDFAVTDAFGTMGRNALAVTDAAARAAGVEASEPRGVPLIENVPRAFTTNDRGATDVETLARERVERTRQIERSFDELEASGASEAQLRAFVQQHADVLRSAAEVSAANRELEQLRRARTAVYRDAALSREERDRILAEIRQDADAAARRIVAAGASPPEANQ